MTEEIFLVKLAKGLETYKTKLELNSLPQLKRAASVLHSSFKNIYGFCIDKKIINVDQYQDDVAVSELTIPSSETFIESKKMIEMSIRIAAYNKQLNFINTSFNYHVDNLDLNTIKRLSELINYIDWTNFSENSNKLITRALAIMVGSLKLGSDPLQLKVIKNDLKRLREEAQNFKEALKAVSLYSTERYKGELRKRITFNGLVDYREDTNEDIEKSIRHMMVREMKDIPIYRNLISQLINDEKTAPASWEKLLKLLSPAEKKTVTAKSLDKNELLKIVQDLGKASLLLNKILKKFDENGIVINRKKRNFFERIAYMLSEAFNKNKKIFYEIEVFNAENTVKKKVNLNYIKFSDELKDNAHKIYLMSTADNLKRLSEIDDEEILIKINASFDIYKRSYRTLSALDTFFKEKAPKAVKSDISGIKVELNGIKMALANSQKKRNEYISQKEEIDQLKKLGIQIEQN